LYQWFAGETFSRERRRAQQAAGGADEASIACGSPEFPRPARPWLRPLRRRPARPCVSCWRDVGGCSGHTSRCGEARGERDVQGAGVRRRGGRAAVRGLPGPLGPLC